MRRIRNSMEAAGMLCEDSKGECNFGQHEINFRYADALRTADEHAIYKNGVKEIAALEGMSITFMAKYDEREGNSCHIHFSLADEQGPLFDRDRALFESFLAGQLAGLRELTLLLAPNVNSYKRYAAATFAPTAVAWGRDNRTCALRVVGHGPVAALREPRGRRRPEPLHGAQRDHRRGPARRRARARARAGLRGQRLRRAGQAAHPDSLRDARELFAASEIARTAFGDDVVDHYVNAADVELDAFAGAVTDWERYRGFERL